MKHTPKEDLLIGAHTSTVGGLYKALLLGHEIGATTIQMFTRNQRRWTNPPLTDEEISMWEEALQETKLKKIMSHDSYLINLGSPREEVVEKSEQAFKEELIRCHQLKISFLNFHPGAALDKSEEECLNLIVKNLLKLEELTDKGATRLLIETTAGQGSTVGCTFEQIGYITERLHKKIPIGVCIDTCHIFAAGYDIRDKKGWDHTLNEFEKHIGLKHLYAFHVNDSMKPFASRRDRHAPLGEGEIGMECFKIMMTHPKLREIPKYLETPDGPPLWVKEIKMLRDFAK